MSRHFTEPSPHEIMLKAGIARRSIMADALTDQARIRREQAEFNERTLNHARHVGPMPFDPSAGDVRRTFYETMRVRGE